MAEVRGAGGRGWVEGDRARGSSKGAHYHRIPNSVNTSAPGVESGGKRGTSPLLR